MEFFILFSLRNIWIKTGLIFSLYLIFNGIERFAIEKIRVNVVYDWGFMQPTQAELISSILILLGTISLFYFWRRKPS